MPAIERRVDAEYGLLLRIMKGWIVGGCRCAVARQHARRVDVGEISAQGAALVVAEAMRRQREEQDRGSEADQEGAGP